MGFVNDCLVKTNNVNGENGPIIDQMREEILVEVKNELQMQNRVFWTRFEERESEAKRERINTLMRCEESMNGHSMKSRITTTTSH
mgnify:CR=1 FL=1